MEFLTALGQDVRIMVKPTRKEQGEMEVVVGTTGLDAIGDCAVFLFV